MPRLSTTLNYHLNGQQMPSKAMEKDLGLIISAYFNWRPHYQSITSRAYKVLGLLRRVFSGSVSVSAKCSLYTSLVRSQLLFFCVLRFCLAAGSMPVVLQHSYYIYHSHISDVLSLLQSVL